MNFFQVSLSLTVTAVVGLATSLPTTAVNLSYSIADLGSLTPGGYSRTFDINNSGQVVGTSTSAKRYYNNRAFLYSDGQMSNLSAHRSGTFSYAQGINDVKDVVGYWNAANGNSHAFLYSSGKMSNLGSLHGSNNSYAQAINNSGQVVGYADTASNDTHAFLYSSDKNNGKLTDLGTLPGGNNSYAQAINNSGQVVGYANTASNNTHAFLYSSGKLIDLGTLDDMTNSTAYGINDAGQIVGSSGNGRGLSTAVIYSSGKMIDLNSLLPHNSGWFLSEARDINNQGQITGIGTLNGQSRAFLMTPVTSTSNR